MGFFKAIKNFLTDYRYFNLFAFAVIILDAIGTYFVIDKVPYTEIDWIAYMQEVRGYLGGELNYSNMRGDTGPLVYPAGFVYLFSGLNLITKDGSDIKMAQLIWYGLYLVQLMTVIVIAKRSRIVPPWALFLFSASYRIHSIFVLRLFNDCWAMTLLYISIALFTFDLWSLGCAVFSFAVSIKMNVLLYSPGLLCLLLQRFGFWKTIPRLFICGIIQLALGAQFLLAYPLEYINGAFEFGRVFTYRWSVNWKFVPEEIFVSKTWAIGLLAGQVFFLGFFAYTKWLIPKSLLNKKLNDKHIVAVLMSSNFVGIMFSRTFHYQFYSWFFHTIPFLLWLTKIPTFSKLLLMVEVELMFIVYPSNPISSAILVASLVIIFLGLVFARFPSANLYAANAAARRKIKTQ